MDKELYEKQSLEEIFTSLDDIIASLQDNDLTLEEMFAGYKQGLELVEACNQKIEKIECDIKVITGDEA